MKSDAVKGIQSFSEYVKKLNKEGKVFEEIKRYYEAFPQKSVKLGKKRKPEKLLKQ